MGLLLRLLCASGFCRLVSNYCDKLKIPESIIGEQKCRKKLVSIVKWKKSTHLVFPNLTSQTPYSSPNSSSRARNWSKERPSMRRFSWSALAKNCLSLREGSTSRGILQCQVKEIEGCYRMRHVPRANIWYGRMSYFESAVRKYGASARFGDGFRDAISAVAWQITATTLFITTLRR